jgi:hypothetical protein
MGLVFRLKQLAPKWTRREYRVWYRLWVVVLRTCSFREKIGMFLMYRHYSRKMRAIGR